MDSTTRLANVAWETMFRAQATLAREFEREGCWGDLLPREYGVLYALSTAAEGLRIIDLCEDALLTQAGVSRLVSRLERRGLVERSADPHDGRAFRLRLTAAGREVQRRVGRAHARQVTTAMTRALTPAQLRTLQELSAVLLAEAEAYSERRTS